MKPIYSLFIFLISLSAMAQGAPPIIDMHVHGWPADRPYGEEDFFGIKGPDNWEDHFKETYAQFRKHNIVKAVVSGPLDSVISWKEWDEDNRIIRGITTSPEHPGMTPERFEALVKEGKVEVFGELMTYYDGSTLSDPQWQPYLVICEKYDIPVAVHTGGGGPGGTHSFTPKARLTLGDPFLLEDVLVNYPRLRLYLMHAGDSFHENALRLMAYYPNLYTDIAVLLWVEPRSQRYAKEFLRNAKQAGYLDRVMFGSDQMFWPDAIERSINYLNSLEFLTEEDKRGIFYHNAARFLRLDG